MKKLLTILAIFISLSAISQKKDTTIQITVTLDQYRALLFKIEQGFDSKALTKDVTDFLNKSAQIVADKPKQ